MESQTKQIWRSPEELVEIGFQRSSVVMMNEAHSGLERCIRTRQVGQRVLPNAHRAGVRHLAMEALHHHFTEKCNKTRCVPDEEFGYLSQPEMREFIQTALDLGWTLIPYEADKRGWLSAKYDVDISQFEDPARPHQTLQEHQAEFLSMEFTNWREEQQALNLIAILHSLPMNTPLLVWCGNSHHSKIAEPEWIPIGYQFQKQSNLNPFVIDQTLTVKFNFNKDAFQLDLVNQFSNELLNIGGTAGFLIEEAPSIFEDFDFADAVLLSIHNELE